MTITTRSSSPRISPVIWPRWISQRRRVRWARTRWDGCAPSWGDDYPLTLGCAANLSVDLRADGAVEEADRLAEDTRARYAATLGAGHPDAEAAAEGRRLDFDIDPPFI